MSFIWTPSASADDEYTLHNLVDAGYTQATFTGDAVDDTLLQLTAIKTALTHLSVTASPKVTDAGISAAVMASPGLTTLSVGGTSVSETYGHFLGKVLALKNLTKFEIKSQLLDMQDTPSRPCAFPCSITCAHTVVYFVSLFVKAPSLIDVCSLLDIDSLCSHVQQMAHGVCS